jgi:thiaminase
MKIKNTSVPFISTSIKNNKKIFLLDKTEIPLNVNIPHIIEQLQYLELSGNMVAWEKAAEIIEKQYNSCVEHIYSHPFWKNLLNDKNQQLVYTYLLETRHYLKAAVSRMAKGINKSYSYNQYNNLIAEHSIEEANHNVFFENALKELHCDVNLLKNSKPLPATLEWIHLMRTVASKNPLVASICSGLLEHTAKDKKLISKWHESLKDKNILKPSAVEAIYKHVKIDIDLGHGENWKEMLQAKQYLSLDELIDCLNSITYVAEIIYRWCENINSGMGYDIVKTSQQCHKEYATPSTILKHFSALPIFPAQLYHDMFYSTATEDKLKEAISIEYAFSKKYRLDSDETITSGNHLNIYIKNWLRAINGHSLWKEMQLNPTYALICGWILENYHYISLISEHTGVAMANCTHPGIQSLLVLHLKEEIDHSKLFANTLINSQYGDISNFRPLATTISFTGALCDLAQRNWQAYCIALAYLQLTISNEKGQNLHKQFYQSMLDKNPDIADLIQSMAKHDDIDNNLGHTDDADKLIHLIYEEGFATPRNLAEASIIPALSWSFLDGIRSHYVNGNAAVYQRIGWRRHYEIPTTKAI